MSREILINPYDMDWGEVEAYKGNFHQHSTESDGKESVAILIDNCKSLGMDMFVVSDHDIERANFKKYPKVTNVPTLDRPTGMYRNTWPLSEFDHDIYYDPNEEGNFTELARKGTKGEFDLDENGVMRSTGMLSFEAVEFTEQHHIISLMGNADGFPGNYDEEFVLEQAESRGGITYLAHPGRHWDVELSPRLAKPEKYTKQWYRRILNEFESCLGLEIDNQRNKYFNDRKLWDTVNNLGFNLRPIWGFSGTDNHSGYNDLNFNVVFMSEFSVDELKHRLKKGNFYSVRGNNPPTIRKIEVDEDNKTITVETNNIEDNIIWKSGGTSVYVGNSINYGTVKGISNFLRVEVRGDGGRAYTNPIYFNRFVADFNFV